MDPVELWYDVWYLHRGKLAAALVALIALAAGIVLLGGSGSDPGEDAAAIEAVTVRTFTTNDPANCSETYTQAFMEQVTGESGGEALATCERNESDNDRPAKSVELSGLSVDGDEAKASVSVRGGSFDGAEFELAYVRQEDSWRLDRAVDLRMDRKALDRALLVELRGEGYDREAVACMVRLVRERVSTREFEAAFLAGDHEVFRTQAGSAAECLDDETLRQVSIRQMREFADSRDLPPAVAACAVRVIRATPAAALRVLAEKPESPQALGFIQAMWQRCAQEGAPLPAS